MTVEDDGLDYRDVNGETVTVTNKLKKGRVLGDKREEEKQKASVMTGDSTPILPLLATMMASGLAALYLALRRRRKI